MQVQLNNHLPLESGTEAILNQPSGLPAGPLGSVTNLPAGAIRLGSWLTVTPGIPPSPFGIQVEIPAIIFDKLNLPSNKPCTAVDVIDTLRTNAGECGFALSDRQRRRIGKTSWDSVLPLHLSTFNNADVIRLVRHFVSLLLDSRYPNPKAIPYSIVVKSADSRSIEGAPVSVSSVHNRLKWQFSELERNRPAHTTDDVWRRAVENAKKSLPIYEQILHLQEKGFSINEISKRIPLNVSTLADWLNTNETSALRALKRICAHVSPRATPLKASLDSMEIWAETLGMYQAVTKGDGRDTHCAFIFALKADAEAAAALLNKLELPRPALVREARTKNLTRWIAASYSESLLSALRKYTGDHSRLPWELLSTQEEKLAYLRGYFLLTGGVHYSAAGTLSYRFESSNHPEVVIGVCALLEEFGIISSLMDIRQLRARIFHPVYLRRLSTLNILPAGEQQLLQSKLAEPDGCDNCPAQTYKEVLKLWNSETRPTQASICRDLKLHPMTLHSWVKKGVKPRETIDQEDLERAKKVYGVPHKDASAYLYRLIGLDGESSFKLGKLLTTIQLKKAYAEAQALQVPPENLVRALEILGATYDSNGQRSVALSTPKIKALIGTA